MQQTELYGQRNFNTEQTEAKENILVKVENVAILWVAAFPAASKGPAQCRCYLVAMGPSGCMLRYQAPHSIASNQQLSRALQTIAHSNNLAKHFLRYSAILYHGGNSAVSFWEEISNSFFSITLLELPNSTITSRHHSMSHEPKTAKEIHIFALP